ncbi:MAG: prolyl oligopeptidase family serine peptidase [Pseudomonadota bacterium]|nr:prolyl oligopeptidase family serine peptidase [Pseudomonadota bacterium]
MRRLLTSMVLALSGHALAQAPNCPDGMPADGRSRAGSTAHCVVVRRIEPPTLAIQNVMIVFMHGDNGGKAELSTTEGAAYRLAHAVGVPAVALLRPGYRSEAGTSDGQSSFQDDDYTAGNVEIVADALASLKALHPGVRILLVGHSGGAAMTALVAGRHPDAADGYLLAGCPCDVARWREWRNESAGKSGRWSRSLSPQAEASRIMPGTRIRLVVGTEDKNTLPTFSEQYAATLKEEGVDARLTLVQGANHGTVLRAPEFYAAAREMALALSAPGTATAEGPRQER